MSKVLKCDLCKKLIRSGEEYELKVKRRQHYWYEYAWIRIDAHNVCIKRIMESIGE